MAPQPEAVVDLFKQLEQQDTQKNFFAQVADDVDWWIVGDTPMSGTYKSKQDFLDATIQILNGKVLGEPLKFRCINVVVGNGDWVTAELEAIDAKCKNGMPYDMRYCWVVRFGQSGKIEQVRAYLDTRLLSKAIETNQ